VTISRAFPIGDPTPSFADQQTALEAAEQKHGYQLNTLWPARYNLCVRDARDREDAVKALRSLPPEVYCLDYAAAFVPRRRASRASERPIN